MVLSIEKLKNFLRQVALLMVGVPDYDVYVKHMRTHHPEKHCMTYEEFFRERQQARYGSKGSGGKCC